MSSVRLLLPALVALMGWIGPAHAAAQHSVHVGPRMTSSVHRFESGLDVGVDLKTFGAAARIVSGLGIGGSVAVERNWLGIACPGVVGPCPEPRSWTMWTGLSGEISLGPVWLRVLGEMGGTRWDERWSRDLRGTALVGAPSDGSLELEVGLGYSRLTPLSREWLLMLGVAWVRRTGTG